MRRLSLLFFFMLLMATAAMAQFTSFVQTALLPMSSNTQDKTQSKVFAHDGRHWAVLPNSSGTHLWRIDGTQWTHVLRLSTKTGSRADCKVVGNLVHVFMYQGANSQLMSLEYDPGSATYKPWSVRPGLVTISLGSGVETAMIEVDGTGRMWLAYDTPSSIQVRWSDAPYTQWSSPHTLASGVTSNDKSAIVAMPGKVGVLWSNQNSRLFGFRTHADGDDPTNWTSDELPASQSAVSVGSGMADDHFNLACTSDGTVYAAVKTGYNKSGYPLIGLLVRRPNGSWDNLHPVSETGTTPTVIVSEVQNKVKVLYTAQTYGSDIVYRESSLSTINFGQQYTLISGAAYRDQSSTKQNYTQEVFVLASNTVSGVAVGVTASDGPIPDPIPVPTPPQAPSLLAPSNNTGNAATSVELSWQTTPDAATYQVQVSGTANFGQLVADVSNLSATTHQLSGLANNSTYYWRVRASNQAGDGTWSGVWSFTTEAATETPPVSSLLGHWRMEENSGNRLLDASGNGNHATFRSTSGVSWTQGAVGRSISLPGTSNRYATVPSNASLSPTEAITLAAWVRPAARRDQTFVSKVYPNGYDLSMNRAGKALLWLNYESHSETYRVESNATLPTNTWVHVAATYDGQVAKIYINGVEDKSVTYPTRVAIGTNNSNFAIGALNVVDFWNGGIDELRVYSTALSPEDIAQLANPALLASSASSSLSIIDVTDADLATENLRLYPNPLVADAVLQFRVPEEGEYAITLYDSKGSAVRVLKQGLATAAYTDEVAIDGAQLPRGLYFIRMQTQSKHSEALKLIVEK